MSKFSTDIMEQKYSQTLKDGSKETWENIAYRVTKHVMKSVGYNMKDQLSKDIFEAIKEKKFIPGGRYLYSAGRDYHQTQNCLLLKAEDSREGWSDLMHKSSMALMTGAGIGVVYSDIRSEGKLIRKTGGKASGPIELMKIINEIGRGVMSGGSRRSAILVALILPTLVVSVKWSEQSNSVLFFSSLALFIPMYLMHKSIKCALKIEDLD